MALAWAAACPAPAAATYVDRVFDTSTLHRVVITIPDLVREPVNQQFLARNFGKDNDGGNLYEVAYPVDLIVRPNLVNLKDEVEEKRSRNDLFELAAAVQAGHAGDLRQEGRPLAGHRPVHHAVRRRGADGPMGRLRLQLQ